jgi:hypothetical protein
MPQRLRRRARARSRRDFVALALEERPDRDSELADVRSHADLHARVSLGGG